MIYREGSGLPVHEVKLLLDRSKEIIDEGEKLSSKIIACTRKAKSAVQVEEDIISDLQVEQNQAIYSRAEPIYDDLLNCMRNIMLNGYKLVIEAREMSEITGVNTSAYSEKNDKIPFSDRVFIRLEDDAIYAKMPMLWTQNSRKIRGVKGNNLSPDRAVYFRDDITAGIKNAPNYKAYSFANFANKIVHFLYVYTDLPGTGILKADNDNHLTKYVLDAVTTFLPGGDSPLTCSIFHSAALSDRVPGGTYMTVTPMRTGIKSSDEILGFWESEFSKIQ